MAPTGCRAESAKNLKLVRQDSYDLRRFCSVDIGTPPTVEGVFAVADYDDPDPADVFDSNRGGFLIDRVDFGPMFVVDGTVPGASNAQTVHRNQINYEWLREWINECRDSHVPCHVVAKERIHDMRLIDCQEECIVSATEDDLYVAMSYVWGSRETGEPDLGVGSALPAALPRTIRDAMTVTQELGLRYLWVDRYCIGGSKKSSHRINQIQQMHQIYRRCQVTIIAAAGDDPTHGLPGVSSPRTIQQATLSLGAVQLIATMSPPQELVVKSLWNTRGWTYQEAIFSRRRLYFTEEQLYLECTCSRRTECMSSPMLETKWEAVRWKYMLTQAEHFNVFANIRQPLRSTDIMYHISVYSERSLSYDFDAINGISAVLRLFQHQHQAVHHYQGIPIMPLQRTKGETNEVNWSLTDRFLSGLCWRSLQHGRRRTSFPSWSWAGWTAVVDESPNELLNDNMLMSQLPLRIEIETRAKQRMDLEIAVTRESNREVFDFSSPMLWVKGPVVDSNLLQQHWALRPSASTYEYTRHGDTRFLEGIPRAQDNWSYEKNGTKGLLIGRSGRRPVGTTLLFVMLIRPLEDTDHGLAYERCGHVDLRTQSWVNLFFKRAREETILLM